MSLTLGSLFTQYGCDKEQHGYATLYQGLFGARRQEPVALLEVGVGTLIAGVPSTMAGYVPAHYKPGGSLRAWRDFFPNGDILGLDVQLDAMIREDRIRTALCDTTDFKSVELTLGSATPKFDIIIDDGCHVPDSQIKTLRHLLPFLKPDGVYVIESVARESWVAQSPTRMRETFPGMTSVAVGTEKQVQVLVTYNR